MVKLGIISALAWAAGNVVASPSSPAPLVGVQTRNLPGLSDEDTLHLLWRRIVHAAHVRRENVFKNSTSLEKSWNDAELFSHTHTVNTTDTKLENLEAELSIEVACSTCYFKGGASVALTVDGDFDFGDAFLNVTGQIVDETKNLTESLVQSLDDVVDWSELRDIFTEDDFEIDEFINFDNFQVDTDFDIDLPSLPEVQLLFQIDHLDLYVELDTTISGQATLTIPLYKSQSPVGITVAPGLEAGIFATMDLILSADAEIVIRSGFHLQLEDPVGFNIALFGKNVSSLILVAEFLTNITGGVEQAAKEDCALKIVQEYTLGLGAAAGATIAVGPHSWGHTPSLSVPIYYTTLADVCAVTAKGSPKPTTTATVTATANNNKHRRDAFTALDSSALFDPAGNQETPTAMAYTSRAREFHTGIQCASRDLAGACPQSLQTTTVLTMTKTYVVTVEPDADPTFPTPTADTVASTIPFGKNVNRVAATSGAPRSYVPPPPPKSSSSTRTAGNNGGGGVLDDIGDVFDGETGGVSNKLIIGLSVGLGVPIVAAAIASVIHYLRRRRYAPVPKSDLTTVEYTGEYESPMAGEREVMVKKTPGTAVS
ncbi:hypothetical protein P885DRAFT_43434 [Corynascus similis CBS 632.67]